VFQYEEPNWSVIDEERVDPHVLVDRDVLGLVGDIEIEVGVATIGREVPGEQLRERRLPDPVRTDDSQHFVLANPAALDLEGELALAVALGEVGVLHERVAVGFGSGRVLLELDGIWPDPHVLVVEVARKVLVDPVADRFRRGDDAVRTRLTVGDVERVREQVENREVVFDDEHRLAFLLGEFTDQPRRSHALADIQVRRDLVEEVKVRIAGERGRDGDPLELPAREVVDRLLHDRPDLEPFDQFVKRIALVGSLEQLSGVPVETVRDLIDVLGLSRDRDIAVAHVRDVVLQFGPSIGLEHLIPARFLLVSAEIGLEFAGQNADGGGLPDSVGTEDPGDLPSCGAGRPYSEKAFSP